MVKDVSQDAIIRIRKLRNCFGPQCVHVDLDLDVRRGEILGVVGGSGTGKSVLLRSIVGLRRPTDGRIEVFGENLTNSAVCAVPCWRGVLAFCFSAGIIQLADGYGERGPAAY
jgi:ABC-type transporter Mla maintaining outer membrane lipid asymmetry ATPase subunit MlaF